jgi:hypothetical protein
MALELTKTTIHGFEAVGAYHRVEGLSLSAKDAIQFAVRTYTTIDKPAFAETFHFCPYDLNGDNPIAQAYNYLKTLPEFDGATDC